MNKQNNWVSNHLSAFVFFDKCDEDRRTQIQTFERIKSMSTGSDKFLRRENCYYWRVRVMSEDEEGERAVSVSLQLCDLRPIGYVCACLLCGAGVVMTSRRLDFEPETKQKMQAISSISVSVSCTKMQKPPPTLHACRIPLMDARREEAHAPEVRSSSRSNFRRREKQCDEDWRREFPQFPGVRLMRYVSEFITFRCI
jgi:hypothetical protein